MPVIPSALAAAAPPGDPAAPAGAPLWPALLPVVVALLVWLFGNGLVLAVLKGLWSRRIRFGPPPYVDAERTVHSSVSHRRSHGDEMSVVVAVPRSRAFRLAFNLVRWLGRRSDSRLERWTVVPTSGPAAGKRLALPGDRTPVTIELLLPQEARLPTRWPWQRKALRDPLEERRLLLVVTLHHRGPVARRIHRRLDAVPVLGEQPGAAEQEAHPGYR